MKDEQITQLSILGVVSVVGLIAAISLLGSPSMVDRQENTNTIGQQGFWDSFTNSQPDNTPEEEPDTFQNENENTNSRFTGSTGQRNPLQILSPNVESVIQETQGILPRIPRSQGIYTYGLSQNPSVNALNQVVNMGGSPVCREAVSLYNDMKSPAALQGATAEDARALDMTTKILEQTMSEGDCWLELYHNKLAGTDFTPVPQNTEELSLEQEYTSNVQTAINALQTNSDLGDALSEQKHSVASLRRMLGLHKEAKQTNTFLAQELSGTNLVSNIRQVVQSDDRSMILGLSGSQGDRVTGPTPERLGVRTAWRVWNNEEMKNNYQEAYDEAYRDTGLSGFLKIFSTSGPSWTTDVASLEEMRNNYPRSPSLTEEDADLLVELTKKGFDPGRVLERKWSIVSGRNSNRADGLLDENNETIWLRSSEGRQRAYERGLGLPVAPTKTLEEELIHFFHYQLGPDRAKEVIDQVWRNTPGADSVTDRESYSTEIDFQPEYNERPHEKLAKDLRAYLTPEVVRTTRRTGRVDTKGELSKRIVSGLVEAYFEDKTPYSPSIESLIIEEIRENQQSQSGSDTTASLNQNGEGSTSNSVEDFFG